MYVVHANFDLEDGDDTSLTSKPGVCIIHVDEPSATVSLGSLEKKILSSQVTFESLEYIVSQDISLIQICLDFEKSIEHLALVNIADASKI